MSQDLVRQRYLEINGIHPMTVEDDEYVTRQFRVLTELCTEAGRDVGEQWENAAEVAIACRGCG